MRLLLTTLAALLLAAPALAEDPLPASFLQYQGAGGTISFTDDPTTIPKAYKASSTQRAFGDVADTHYMELPETGAHHQALLQRLEYYRDAAAQAREFPQARKQDPQDFPERRLHGTRSLGGDLTVGGGRFTTVRQRFDWDGINEPMNVLYGPDGEVWEVYPTSGAGVYSGYGDGSDRFRKEDHPRRDRGEPNPRYRANFILGDAPPLGRSRGIPYVDGTRPGRGHRSGHGKSVQRPGHRSRR